jgi:hypothetical protein
MEIQFTRRIIALWTAAVFAFLPGSATHAADEIPQRISEDGSLRSPRQILMMFQPFFEQKGIDYFPDYDLIWSGDDELCEDFYGLVNDHQADLLISNRSGDLGNGYRTLAWEATDIYERLWRPGRKPERDAFALRWIADENWFTTLQWWTRVDGITFSFMGGERSGVPTDRAIACIGSLDECIERAERRQARPNEISDPTYWRKDYKIALLGAPDWHPELEEAPDGPEGFTAEEWERWFPKIGGEGVLPAHWSTYQFLNLFRFNDRLLVAYYRPRLPHLAPGWGTDTRGFIIWDITAQARHTYMSCWFSEAGDCIGVSNAKGGT